METKNEKFLRMLDGRLPKALHAIGLLENLSRKNDYEWTPAQLQSMLDQLDDAVDGVAQAFGLMVDAAKAPPKPPASAAEGEVDLLALMRREQQQIMSAGPVPVSDKAALKRAYDMIAGGDAAGGMKAMGRVFLGWSHISAPEENDR
jgi:hypothetical protein